MLRDVLLFVAIEIMVPHTLSATWHSRTRRGFSRAGRIWEIL